MYTSSFRWLPQPYVGGRRCIFIFHCNVLTFLSSVVPHQIFKPYYKLLIFQPTFQWTDEGLFITTSAHLQNELTTDQKAMTNRICMILTSFWLVMDPASSLKPLELLISQTLEWPVIQVYSRAELWVRASVRGRAKICHTGLNDSVP